MHRVRIGTVKTAEMLFVYTRLKKPRKKARRILRVNAVGSCGRFLPPFGRTCYSGVFFFGGRAQLVGMYGVSNKVHSLWRTIWLGAKLYLGALVLVFFTQG